MKHLWEFMLAGMLVGCGRVFAETGQAVIHGTTEGSKLAGTATFTETPAGLKAVIQITNAPPGTHGLHIHEKGSCDEQGNAAGGHYNPDGVKHGFLPKDSFTGAHAGDLGNIEIAPDGSGALILTLANLHVTKGKYTVGGRTVILHQKADDFGQPTGNAGARIGCGQIVASGP